jgi:hypothetical protein
MSTSWVAASVRARALARRRLGAAGARRLAASGSLRAAVTALADSPYGHDVGATDSIVQAQHAVGASVLWSVRVLGGWVPRSGVPALRAMAAAFEVANIDEHLRGMHGQPTGRLFKLGSFATAWPRIVVTSSTAELREQLQTSAWGDPGSDSEHTIHLYLRVTWAARVAAAVELARPWMRAATELVLTREHLLSRRSIPATVLRAADPVVGTQWTPTETDATRLWRAEAGFWRDVEHDAFAALRGSSFDIQPTVAALALLAVDAWRVRAALETAAGQHDDLELFDAVA